MKIIRYLLICAVILAASDHLTNIYAQTLEMVSGQITDSQDRPLAGVVITAADNKTYAVSDTKGCFEIRAEMNTKLNVSCIGFITQDVLVDSDRLLIVMEEEVLQIDDVVVVAYGTQKKESLSGSVSSIRNDELITTKAPSLAQSLQGKVAGLRIRQTEGQPGQFGNDINIRGLGAPIFVIDGVKRDDGNEFQRLNPNDIESISFIKDGTAAIYGMNSSNGVILVTTKKGKSGRTTISLDSNVGFAQPTDIPEMMNAGQYYDMLNDANILGKGTPLMTQEELAKWKNGTYQSFDYYDAVFKPVAIQQRHTLSFSGGNDRVTFFGSLGYMNDRGLLRTNDIGYEQYTFRANTSIKVARYLTAEFQLSGRADQKDQPSEGFFNIYKQTMVTPPYYDLYANGNQDYLNEFMYGPNPLAISNSDISGYDRQNIRRVNTLFALNYDMSAITKGLKLRGQISYDYSSSLVKVVKKEYNTYVYSKDPNTGEDIYTAKSRNDPSEIVSSNDRMERLNFQLQLNYNRMFANAHNVGVTLVMEGEQTKTNYFDAGRYYDLYTLDDLNFGRTKDMRNSGNSGEARYLSYIGRLNYDYKGRYFVEGAFRYEGSYKYKPSMRWALSPSVSVAWRISEEPFVANNVSFIDNLKLRASFGESGYDNDANLVAFQHIPGFQLNDGCYEFVNGSSTYGVSQTGIINPDLTWIKTRTYNIGLDLSIFRGLFALEMDIYQRTRTGLPADRNKELPNTFGESKPKENLNSDCTRGLEFNVSHSNTIGEFSYKISGNFNIARTRNLYIEQGTLNSSWDIWRNQASWRYNDFIWGYKVAGQYKDFDQIGLYPNSGGANGNRKELVGDFYYEDVNGDGIIDSRDQLPLYRNSTPLVYYGLNIDLSWRNFDFYALFQGAAFYTIQLKEAFASMFAFGEGNMPSFFYDRWRLADPYDPDSEWIPGEWPAARKSEDMGSFYMENTDVWRRDASYLRLKSLELGYTLDPKLTKKAHIERLRIFINGNNLFTFCDKFVRPFDPEKVEGAFSAGMNYPLTKSYNIGVNLTF